MEGVSVYTLYLAAPHYTVRLSGLHILGKLSIELLFPKELNHEVLGEEMVLLTDANWAEEDGIVRISGLQAEKGSCSFRRSILARRMLGYGG